MTCGCECMSECMSRTEAAICKTSDGAAADDEDRDGSNPCNTEAQRLAGRCSKGSAADVGVTAADNKKAFGFRQGFLSSRKGRGNGAGERNRTSDLRITNALLYQLSYTGISQIVSASLRRTALNRICAFYGDFEKKQIANAARKAAFGTYALSGRAASESFQRGLAENAQR